MKKIFITGGTGFVGSHLLDLYLKDDNVELFSIKRRRSNVDNVEHIKNRVTWFDVDITDAHCIESVIREINPDVIHHLAAQSFVKASFTNPAATIEVNLLASLHILEAVKKFAKDCIVHVASSSEVYGIPEEVPITEKMVPCPISPYAISKLAMDHASMQYHRSYGIKTVITRTFNHGGPRRGKEFVCSSFAKQIADIEKGLKEPIIEVGNLESFRDFTDVRDIIVAYRLAIEKCNYGEPYNIASNKTISIKEILDKLLSFSSFDNVDIRQDKDRLRPSDLNILQGDATKFITATEWQPKYSLDEMLLDLLNYWREKNAK